MLKSMEPESHAPQVGALDLFLAFTRITLVSFGGVLFWCRRLLVERRRWLTEQEFVEIVALSQLLPGVNGINLTVMVGYRFAGWAGAAGALAGFLGAPVLVVSAIAVLHERYGELALVQSALTGMSAVAVGLLISTGAKVASVLQRRWRPYVFVVLAFVGVGVMRWPLLAVLAVLAPWAITAAWKGKA
ncbi:MAG TPA: chromate transporter [Burkholderiales bacterium]|jgi:chromate transporter|nr:chromate transporter [Burkholderiales bacterium]